MTDTTQPQPQAQPQPAPAPVDDLQANIDAFFGHRLSDPVEETPAAPPAEPTNVQPQTETPPVGLNPPSPAPAPNAEPAASQNEGGEPEVDPGLIAEVLLGQAPQAPQPQEQQPPAASAPPSSDEDKPYMPIKPEAIRLPQAQLDAIFRSEDPQEQERALVALMASWMNAGIAMMDARVREHYAPRIAQQSQQQLVSANAARAIEEDFFGTYPDLKAVPQLVERVSAHFARQNPQAKWGPELKAKIGDNARALAKQMNIKLEGAPQAQPPAPAQPFVLDSARPASVMPSGQPDYSPAALVEELTRF